VAVRDELRRVKKGLPGLLRRGRRWLAGKYREVPLRATSLRSRFDGESVNSVRPENIVWIFGSGRSGSTWLRSMMGDSSHHVVWEEPMVGQLFGNFHRRAQTANLVRPDFVMADATRRGWIHSIRNFVLDGARYARPRLGPGHFLIVKEPNGSVGAPLLMEALPESGMIFLIRDPRDVVASSMDARSEGSWLAERREDQGRASNSDKNPNLYARTRANSYVQQIEKTRQAYTAHGGRKVMVRYEDLRADTLKTMRRIYSALEIPVEEAELARSVEKCSWENIPEEEKGQGKKRRKAQPGGWNEDLSAKQVEIVEDITGPLLDEFYPHTATTRGAL
jgi:hypothetical protein